MLSRHFRNLIQNSLQKKEKQFCQKTDIFKGHLWYAYEGEWMNWHVLTTDQANEIIEKNKKREKVASLEEYASLLVEDTKTEFENVVGQDSLTRFDSPKRKKKRRNNKGRQNQRPKNEITVMRKIAMQKNKYLVLCVLLLGFEYCVLRL